VRRWFLWSVALFAVAFAVYALAQPTPGSMAQLTTPAECSTLTHTSTAVTTATNIPATSQGPRRWIEVCYSAEETNTGTILKCRADGVNPVCGLGNAGDALAFKDCILYPVLYATSGPGLIKCVSCSGTINTTSRECF
jgi:hypothetical protein